MAQRFRANCPRSKTSCDGDGTSPFPSRARGWALCEGCRTTGIPTANTMCHNGFRLLKPWPPGMGIPDILSDDNRIQTVPR